MVDAFDYLKMKVNLFISGRNLKDLDSFSKSDPRCILYELRNNDWSEIGRTEVIMNNLNPDFTNSIKVDYFFEQVQKFKFSFIDEDNRDDF